MGEGWICAPSRLCLAMKWNPWDAVAVFVTASLTELESKPRRQVTINNLGIGRSVDETIRLIQAHQFLVEHGEVSLSSSAS